MAGRGGGWKESVQNFPKSSEKKKEKKRSPMKLASLPSLLQNLKL